VLVDGGDYLEIMKMWRKQTKIDPPYFGLSARPRDLRLNEANLLESGTLTIEVKNG